MAEPWKITHVLPALTKGGAERVAVDLANHAARQGHKVTVVVGFRVDDGLLRNALEPEVDVRYVSTPITRLRPSIEQYAWLWSWLWQNRTWLAQQDIVHCHLSFASVAGSAMRRVRRLLRAKKPRIVETYHAVGMPIPHWRRAVHARLAANRDAMVFMAEDEYWSAFVTAHPKLITRIIPNGINPSASPVDEAARTTYRRAAGIPDECRLIMGTVGMLRVERETWRYLPIFDEVARKIGPDVHFLVAGGGGELERMRALVKSHALLEGRVHLPGLALDPAVPRAIMDLYITLNVGSITGLAALEAAATGLPTIAVQLLSDYRSREEDWIWSSSDESKVAQRAVELLGSQTERKRLGAKQRKYVRTHLTIDAMAHQYYSLYEQIIAVTEAP